MSDEQPEIDLDLLYQTCETIHKSYKELLAPPGNRDPIGLYLGNYNQILDTSDWGDHKDIFFDLYAKKRESVLLTLDSTQWLQQDVTAWYGEKVPEVRKLNAKLCISMLYKKAVEMKEHLHTKLDEDKILEDERCWLDDTLLYHLLKTFHRAIDGTRYDSDQSSLRSITSEIASRASIDENALVKPKTPNTTTTNPLQNVIGMFAPMIDSMGFKTDDGRPISEALSGIDPSTITHHLANTIQNRDIMERMGTQIGDVFQQVQSGGEIDPTRLMSNFKDTMKDAIMTSPPAGVTTDTRTEEEKRAVAETIDNAFERAAGMLSNITGSPAPASK